MKVHILRLLTVLNRLIAERHDFMNLDFLSRNHQMIKTTLSAIIILFCIQQSGCSARQIDRNLIGEWKIDFTKQGGTRPSFIQYSIMTINPDGRFRMVGHLFSGKQWTLEAEGIYKYNTNNTIIDGEGGICEYRVTEDNLILKALNSPDKEILGKELTFQRVKESSTQVDPQKIQHRE